MEILKKYIIPAILFIMLFACEEREEPQPLTGAPEFYLIGEFNGEPFEYYAGENGFINEAYSFKGPEGTTWLASRFSHPANEDFNFEFAISNPEGNEADIVTEPGNVIIQSDSINDFYEVTFNSGINNPAYTYTWDFGDGNKSSEINPVHRYPISDSDYTVCLSIENDNNCIAEICQVIKPYLSGRLDITASQVGSGLWVFEPILTDFEAITYIWTLADGTFINTRQIALQTDSNSVFEVCLKALSRKLEAYEKCIQANTGINQNACIANFDANSTMRTDTISNAELEKAIAGTLIVNNIDMQIADFEANYFEIQNSEPYAVNAGGQPTRKVQFIMELRLIDENGSLNHLKITEGVMAVGI